MALRDCAPRRRWHRNVALQETGHLTFNHSASPGRFEACCFFILRYPHRELLLIINPAVTVKLTICYAFHMLSTLYVSSCFIPESYTINKAVPSFKKKNSTLQMKKLKLRGDMQLVKDLTTTEGRCWFQTYTLWLWTPHQNHHLAASGWHLKWTDASDFLDHVFLAKSLLASL